MNFPVIKACKYISPSSFMEYCGPAGCPYKFYQKRLAGHPYIKETQTIPAVIGSIFDAHAKSFLSKEFNVQTPVTQFNRLINENVKYTEENLPEILEKVRKIWEWYKMINQWKFFQNYEEDEIEFELDLFEILNIHACTPIPIYGKPDARCNDKPFDWKLTIGNLTPGYNYRSDTGQYHPDRNKPLEYHNIYWATQMLFYCWLLGNTDLTCTIHQIKYKPNGECILATHERYISQKFADETLVKLQVMWDNISQLDCEIPEPSPQRFKCEAFNTLCPVACRCHWYERTLGDSERRAEFV